MTRSNMRFLIGAALLPCALAARGAGPEPNDYSKPQAWLCRPDVATGPCHGPLNVLVVPPDGHVTPQIYRPDEKPKIDCFYVYPTSSEDRTPNSDMTPGRESEATASQFGQFGARCRQWAPVYRSVTLFALMRARLGAEGGDWDLAYRDVRDAWSHYLAHDNDGRGVVLVGHSQGANLLVRLLREEIDGKPAQKLLVSALIAGWPVEVPPGKDVGGSFKTLRLCTSGGQFGCVMNWSAFRADVPPAEHPPSTFGHGSGGLRAACTNPAALGSDKKVALDSYFLRGDVGWTSVDRIDTNYVRVPGLASGQCVTRGDSSYLEITVNADPKDPRSDTIPGDVMVDGARSAFWGLHRVDMSLVMGNLLDDVDAQAKAWLAKKD